MTDAQKMKAVIDRVNRNTGDRTWQDRLDNTPQPPSPQRTPTMQPKHETPKER
jgi:hypothetical protein